MSPILLRPNREQFEHNRIIRLLQTRLRRRHLVGVNFEDEREATGSNFLYLIVSLVTAKTRAFRLVDGRMEEVPLQVVADA